MIGPVGTPGARGPFPAAEHRNGVKFPGEPVAVMAEGRSIDHWAVAWEGGAPCLMPQPKDLPGKAVPEPRVLGVWYRKGWERIPGLVFLPASKHLRQGVRGRAPSLKSNFFRNERKQT